MIVAVFVVLLFSLGKCQNNKAKLISAVRKGQTNENITVPNNFNNNYGPIFNSTNGNGNTYNLDLDNDNNLNNLNNTTVTIINYFSCDGLFKQKKQSLLRHKKQRK